MNSTSRQSRRLITTVCSGLIIGFIGISSLTVSAEPTKATAKQNDEKANLHKEKASIYKTGPQQQVQQHRQK